MAYAERVGEDYSEVQILGRANRVPLENLTAVNVLQKLTALRYACEQLHDLQREALLQDKRRDGSALTAQTHFVLGTPGAAKTTLLNSVAINAVQGFITAEIAKTAIYSQKAHADLDRSLFESVQHELSMCRFPEAEPWVKRPRHANTIVLLDGSRR